MDINDFTNEELAAVWFDHDFYKFHRLRSERLKKEGLKSTK